MGKRPNRALIGGFVLGALALVVAALVMLGSGRFFRHADEFVLYFGGSVNGLEKGAAVKYRGVPVGAVSDILLALPQKRGDPRIPVLIEIDHDRLAELGATREMSEGPEMMSRLLRDAGLRAQLQQQSFITGLLYIGLDLVPGSPLDLAFPEGGPYPEIATLPTKLEQAQAKIEAVIERLVKIDFEGLGRSLADTVNGINHLVSSPDVQSTLVALREALGEIRAAAAELRSSARPLAAGVNGTTTELRASLKRLQTSLDRLDVLTDPKAPLVQGLTTSLADFGKASRAVRQLAEDLDRDPSVLLRGRTR